MPSVMNAIGAAQIDAMAVGTEALGVPMLKKALDTNALQMAQLLQSLPQKDGAGSILDVQL